MAVPFPKQEGERVLGLAPFVHTMGLCCVLNHVLASGGTVVAQVPKSPPGKLLRRVLDDRERETVRDCAPQQTTTKRAGRTYTPWGMLAAIDLHGVARLRLADADSIRRFVPALIAAIGMRAHGALMIDRFGDDELEGWSALQFIETSSISIHADEVFGRCFIDVFSCRPFDPDTAAAIAVAYFGGTPTVTVLQR